MEIELKYALENAQQYHALLEFLRDKSGQAPETLQQENIFFDTNEGRLRANGLVLRLRDENENYWLTAKGSAVTEHLNTEILSSRLEEEISVSSAQAQQLLSYQTDPISLFNAQDWPQSAERQRERLFMIGALQKALQKAPLVVVGRFCNTRRIFPVHTPNGVYKIECDATVFPGDKRDFEFEIELADANDAKPLQQEVEQWLNELNIPVATNSGKATRFFNIIAANKDG